MTRYLALVVLLSSAACGKTLSAHTTQPNPLKYPAEFDKRSEKLVIQTRDMELPRAWLLNQSAYFSVVSRDRLRFHIRLTHKWEEYADLSGWEVQLVDDKGRVYHPDEKDTRSNRHVTRVWDYERRTAQFNMYGDIKKVNDDGYKDRTALASLDVFKGSGDVAFHGKDLFTREVKQLTLVMKKGDLVLRFSWKFSDDPREWKEFRRHREPASYAEDFETAHVCTDLSGNPMPMNGGCVSGRDPGRGR